MPSKSKNIAESQIYDVNSTATGAFDLPSGTTAQRPGSPNSGQARFNSTIGSLEFYDGNGWVQTNLTPTINSITGNINNGYGSTLTLNVSNSTDTVSLQYKEGNSVVATVGNVGISGGTGTTVVPAAVYGQTAGDTLTLSVLNADGTPSTNTVTKTVLAAPTGGAITTSGNFRIHTFTSSGTFAASGFSISNAEYLVIAGGGGGGSDIAGGGGAGGYRSSVVGQGSGGGGSAEARITVAQGNHTVTIGAGGAGGTAGTRDTDTTTGTTGSNSVFGSITSTGGGGGGVYGAANSTRRDGKAGGSGGGSGAGDAGDRGIAGAGTSGQGYVGGRGSAGNPYDGGGGGGAGAAGGDRASATQGGAGGAGVSSNITGSAVTRAGGGGGACYNNADSSTPVGGVGGSGGGGRGGAGSGSGALNVGVDGTVNTGSGGGGSSWNGAPIAGADGASGIVIVRYDMTAN